MCRVLEVSRSGYYAWRSGKTHSQRPETKRIEKVVVDTFWEHKRRYGARRISKALGYAGENVGRYKVGYILHKCDLKAIQPRSYVPKTTDSRHIYPISPNLLLHRAMPERPNEVWVGDFTYLPLMNGSWAFLAEWMDLFSRRIVGWQVEDNMEEQLVISAMQKALRTREIPAGLIAHTDRGGQYAGNSFRMLLAKHKIQQSMSRADNPYDNAFMESCFSRFKAELLQGNNFQNVENARSKCFEFIEAYYNTQRLHSSLSYLSPDEFEKLNQ